MNVVTTKDYGIWHEKIVNGEKELKDFLTPGYLTVILQNMEKEGLFLDEKYKPQLIEAVLLLDSVVTMNIREMYRQRLKQLIEAYYC